MSDDTIPSVSAMALMKELSAMFDEEHDALLAEREAYPRFQTLALLDRAVSREVFAARVVQMLQELQMAIPAEEERDTLTAKALEELKGRARKLQALEAINRDLLGRVIGCLGGYLDALEPAARAYDASGKLVERASPYSEDGRSRVHARG